MTTNNTPSTYTVELTPNEAAKFGFTTLTVLKEQKETIMEKAMKAIKAAFEGVTLVEVGIVGLIVGTLLAIGYGSMVDVDAYGPDTSGGTIQGVYTTYDGHKVAAVTLDQGSAEDAYEGSHFTHWGHVQVQYVDDGGYTQYTEVPCIVRVTAMQHLTVSANGQTVKMFVSGGSNGTLYGNLEK